MVGELADWLWVSSSYDAEKKFVASGQSSVTTAFSIVTVPSFRSQTPLLAARYYVVVSSRILLLKGNPPLKRNKGHGYFPVPPWRSDTDFFEMMIAGLNLTWTGAASCVFVSCWKISVPVSATKYGNCSLEVAKSFGAQRGRWVAIGSWNQWVVKIYRVIHLSETTWICFRIVDVVAMQKISFTQHEWYRQANNW